MFKKLLTLPLHWRLCFASIVVVTFYWMIWASDRFVSEANVVLESPQPAVAELNFQSLLGGGGRSHGDMLLLRDHILSVDMMLKADHELALKKHYTNRSIDYFSRLSSGATLEDFHSYFKKRVDVQLDDYAGVLRFHVMAFEAKKAQALADFLLKEGERYMNQLGQQLAEEQVRFLEKQVVGLEEHFYQAQKNMLTFQNKEGMISPTKALESFGALVATLEGQLAAAKARRSALLNFHSNNTSEVRRVNAEIDALKQQVVLEKSRLAQNGGHALNEVSSSFQVLEMQLNFAQQSYSTTLMALENMRIEAARKLKQVSIVQKPTLPDYDVEPKRAINSVAFTIAVLLFGIFVHMVILIVKDHKD